MNVYLPFAPRRYAHFVSLVLVVLGLLLLCEPIFGFRVQVGSYLSITGLVAGYFICLGLVVGGSVFLRRIDPVLTKAQRHRLYVETIDNKGAAEIALRIHGNFQGRAGIDFGQMGGALVWAAVIATPWPLMPGLTTYEWVASAGVAMLMLLVIYPLLIIYPIYANASVPMQALPRRAVRVDLYAADGRLGIGDLIDLVVGGIVFNVTASVVLWVVWPIAMKAMIPGREWWALGATLLGLVLAYPIALFRVTQLRLLWGVRGIVAASVTQAIYDELDRLQQRPATERIAHYPALDRVRHFPVLTGAARGRIKELVTVVLIPLAMLAGDKFYTAMTASGSVSP